jgi:thiamine monophosphate synthase
VAALQAVSRPRWGVLWRHAGMASLPPVRALVRAADRHGVGVWLSARTTEEARLALQAGCAGVHVPEVAVGLKHAVGRWAEGLRWTCAAHDARAVRRAVALGYDGVLISKVFASASSSPGEPKGLLRVASLARGAKGLTVYGLGGVSPATAARLHGRGLGCAVVAGAEALAADVEHRPWRYR